MLMPPEVEIFASGQHTSSNGVSLSFTNEDLDAIASNYDPKTFDAPIVVGHPKDNSPAYGWVESIQRKGDKLVAKLRDWHEGFQEAVKNKHYKKISASFYSPDSPSNPKPGSYYLRHVGFLGGMAPAVKGLASVAFADNEEGVVEFCGNDESIEQLLRNLREWFIEQKGVEAANKVLPEELLRADDKEMNYEMDTPPWAQMLIDRVSSLEAKLNQPQRTYSYSEGLTPEQEQKLEELGKRAIELINKVDAEPEYIEEEPRVNTEYENRVAQLEQQLAEQKVQRRRESLESFSETLVREGKILPADKDAIVDFMCSLPEDEELEFGEGYESRVAFMQRFLSDRPKVVEFKEIVSNDDFTETDEIKDAYANARKAYESSWRTR